MGSEFEQGLQLAAVGVGTVFLALIITGLAVTLIGLLFKEKETVPAATKPPLPEESTSGLSKHTLVLLAAAAAVAVKRPVRIRRVRFVSQRQRPESWAQSGRSVHQRKSLN
jgi:Na+-transporting methylmalonyl-CoA/oxaloacetate decarboxylase gamma subunit